MCGCLAVFSGLVRVVTYRLLIGCVADTRLLVVPRAVHTCGMPSRQQASRTSAFTARRHEQAVTEAEIRHLQLALAPFGVLSRAALRERSGSALWHEGTFERALRAAVDRGILDELPGGFFRETR